MKMKIDLMGYKLSKWLARLAEKLSFRKRFDYRKLLDEASVRIAQIKSLYQLFNLMVHFATMHMGAKNAAILTYDEKDKVFRFMCTRGYALDGWFKSGHLLGPDDALVQYLSHKREPLDIERVKELTEKSKSKPEKERSFYDYAAVLNRMEEFQAACCIPSYFGGQLKNILILGPKKTGQFYWREELEVLFTLAQESAIAMENARLYDQAVEKAKELEAINEQLNAAQTNLLRALDDTEVANKRLKDTHAQLIHEQKMATLGRLASSVGHEVNNPLTILSMNVSRVILKFRRDPDLKVSEILDTLQKMDQNISRIKAVVNTLTGLLKKSERGKFEPLSLKLILEETLPLVQFQTYLENLSGTEVVFEVPANLPLVKGDLERLQEVFLNLFINAYHAMAMKKERKISVSAHESPAHSGMVLIEFSDNGLGMSDEVMKKAFTYGFTTKSAGKGSGMGLYMCRYIIELHGGEIKVRSKLGEGTTFVITLPIYQEISPSMESAERTAP
jgi:signal transduction histidine kinase